MKGWRNKHFRKIIISVSGLLLLAGLSILCIRNRISGDVVMEVNGHPVHLEEFQMLLKENENQYLDESMIHSESSDKDEVIQKNIEYCTKIKILQEEAQKYGIIRKFDWLDIEKTLKNENQDRARKMKKGEPVYGVQEFSIEQYYSYFMDNMVNELKRKLLGAEDFDLNEEEIQSYYESLGQPMMFPGEKMKYSFCDISATSGNGNENTVCNEVIECLKNNSSIQEVEVQGYHFQVEHKTMDMTQLRDLVRSSWDGERILQLMEGEVIGPVAIGEMQQVVRYEGFVKKEKLTQTDKDVIRGILQDAKFEEWLEALIKEAEIEIHAGVMQKVVMNG